MPSRRTCHPSAGSADNPPPPREDDPSHPLGDGHLVTVPPPPQFQCNPKQNFLGTFGAQYFPCFWANWWSHPTPREGQGGGGGAKVMQEPPCAVQAWGGQIPPMSMPATHACTSRGAGRHAPPLQQHLGLFIRKRQTLDPQDMHVRADRPAHHARRPMWRARVAS